MCSLWRDPRGRSRAQYCSWYRHECAALSGCRSHVVRRVGAGIDPCMCSVPPWTEASSAVAFAVFQSSVEDTSFCQVTEEDKARILRMQVCVCMYVCVYVCMYVCVNREGDTYYTLT